MADFMVNNEYDENDPDIVTNINCYFEPSIDANLIHSFLQGFGRKVREYGTKAVIEEMRRVEGHKLYVCVGFRELDSEKGIEQDEDGCMEK